MKKKQKDTSGRKEKKEKRKEKRRKERNEEQGNDVKKTRESGCLEQ